jgi:hypothetical protein
MKIVSKLTQYEELSNAIGRCYEDRGFKTVKLIHPDNRTQIGVPGKLVKRYTSAGVCNSFGGGVPPLVQIAPLYHFVLNGRFNTLSDN